MINCDHVPLWWGFSANQIAGWGGSARGRHTAHGGTRGGCGGVGRGQGMQEKIASSGNMYVSVKFCLLISSNRLLIWGNKS